MRRSKAEGRKDSDEFIKTEAFPQRKRAKAEEDPDCGFEKGVFLCGTELSSISDLWNGPLQWNFTHLLPAIRDRLSSNNSKAFVFGSSEMQGFSIDDKVRVLPIPVMTVVFSTVSPPELIGITSVQASTERIVPMSSLKMSFTPWKADVMGRKPVDHNVDDRIFVLYSTSRTVKKHSPQTLRDFEYALPYLLRERDVREEPVTHAICSYASGEKTFEFGFDKEVLIIFFLFPR